MENKTYSQAKTLFIFEGAKTEEKLVEKLECNFLGDNHAIKCVFDAEIYQLYRKLHDDSGFPMDIVSILKERTKENAESLKYYNRNSFAYIYLFFDYDAHATAADDQKIDELLSFSMTKRKKACSLSVIRWWKPSDTFAIRKVSSR